MFEASKHYNKDKWRCNPNIKAACKELAETQPDAPMSKVACGPNMDGAPTFAKCNTKDTLDHLKQAKVQR